MKKRAKPGIDWGEIKRDFKAGESCYSISKRVDVTKQSILERKHREGWERDEQKEDTEEQTDNTELREQIENLPSIRTDQYYDSLRTTDKCLKIIERYKQTGSLTNAVNSVGHALKSLQTWMDADPDFMSIMVRTKAQFEWDRLESIRKAEDRGDWQASKFMLEKAPATKAEYGAAQSQGQGGITVIFQGVPKPGEIIENES